MLPFASVSPLYKNPSSPQDRRLSSPTRVISKSLDTGTYTAAQPARLLVCARVFFNAVSSLLHFAVDAAASLRRQNARETTGDAARGRTSPQKEKHGGGGDDDGGAEEYDGELHGVGVGAEARDSVEESPARFAAAAPAIDYSASGWWTAGHKANDTETILNRVELLKFKLGRLDLGGLGLLHPLPTLIFTPADLLSLQLQENNLVALSPAISWARNLRQLRLFSNQLVVLPDEIGDLPRLEMLWLHDNHLVALPATVGKLTTLKFLTLRTNCLSALPYTLHQLQKLQEFDWQGNVIRDPPELVRRLLPPPHFCNFQRRSIVTAKRKCLNSCALWWSADKLAR
jgi:hypothetical protein